VEQPLEENNHDNSEELSICSSHTHDSDTEEELSAKQHERDMFLVSICQTYA